MASPRILVALLITLIFLAAARGAMGAPAVDPYACDQHCCCKVCSAQSMDAFPYGLPTYPNALNVRNPTVIGASCGVPVWSAYPYNDTNGNPLSVPDTLFWTNHGLFGDDDAHVAPTTCSCCKLSVDTSCSEAAPLATRPKTITITTGKLITGQAGLFSLHDGVELSTTDSIQLRRDTYCGYNGSSMVINSPGFVPSADGTRVDVNVQMPAAACYSVCYYHSTLTTPTWYLIGLIVVNPATTGAVTFTTRSDEVLLGGNVVTLTFNSGADLLSPFDDIAEIRSSGACGAANPLSRAGAGGVAILEAPAGSSWCSPAVVPKITTVRPLRYVDVKYQDCAASNRIYLAKLQWSVRLPAPTTTTSYTVCYRRGATTWLPAVTISVLGRATQLTALQQLYASTGGANWLRNGGWSGTNVCLFHGVRCDSNNKVVSIHLGRNGLLGPLPTALFLSDLAGTLTYLALDMNNITGAIPVGMGAMKVLEYVDVGFNQMTGGLPNTLLGMTNIDVVYVSNNQFGGATPSNVHSLSLQWLRNNLEAPVVVEPAPECPVDTVVCVDQGSTAPGVFSCGYDGITELECVVMGCCFNAQAPLVFGGSTCFTKRSTTYFTYPQCEAASCVTQADVIQ